jgi:UDP-N-acetylmuramoylalanine--D-glutamate ligase
LEDYGLAKLRLRRNPSKNNLFIVGEFEKNVLDVERASIKREFTFLNIPAQDIYESLGTELDLNKFKPVGEHNLSNLWVAIKVCESLCDLKTRAVQHFLENFQGPEHRLEPIVKTDLRWILNDSKSTNWASTLVALRACRFAPRPFALVLGGQKRGENDSILPYLSTISEYVDEIILIGESGESIFYELKSLQYSDLKYSYISSLLQMTEEYLTKRVNLGLLFSPAFPSFDQYKNYEERGTDFKSIIKSFVIN